MFTVPKSDELRAKWARNIPRSDKSLKLNCRVCEKHFDEQYISRYFVHIIKSVEEKIPRQNPVLKDGAVPTIFPNLPKYLSSVPKKRKLSSRSEEPILPKRKKYSREKSQELPEVNIENLEKIGIPSYWSILHFKGNPKIIGFA